MASTAALNFQRGSGHLPASQCDERRSVGQLLPEQIPRLGATAISSPEKIAIDDLQPRLLQQPSMNTRLANTIVNDQIFLSDADPEPGSWSVLQPSGSFQKERIGIGDSFREERFLLARGMAGCAGGVNAPHRACGLPYLFLVPQVFQLRH